MADTFVVQEYGAPADVVKRRFTSLFFGIIAAIIIFVGFIQSKNERSVSIPLVGTYSMAWVLVVAGLIIFFIGLFMRFTSE